MSTYLPELTRRMLRAAATHSGAMVALIPSAQTLPKLAVYNGEAPEDLHVTLAYLGEGAEWSEEQRFEMVNALSDFADQQAPHGRFWATASFNPGTEDACVAHLVEGLALETVMREVRTKLQAKFPIPVQHSPWIPHMTIAYGVPADEISTTLMGQTITFDALRLAFAGDVLDIPFAST